MCSIFMNKPKIANMQIFKTIRLIATKQRPFKTVDTIKYSSL